MNTVFLTEQNIKAGLKIVQSHHPEWGTWIITWDGYHWGAHKSGKRNNGIALLNFDGWILVA